MKNILQTVFLSSEGTGNLSLMWKGILMVALGYLFPSADQGGLASTADIILTAIGAGVVAWGGFRKLGNSRWSKPVV